MQEVRERIGGIEVGMKEKLAAKLGVLGYVIFYLIAAFFAYCPLIFLDFPFIVNAILIGVIMFLPIIGTILNLILWIWSFVVVLSAPIDIFSILYFIAFAVYIISEIITMAVSLVSTFLESNTKK